MGTPRTAAEVAWQGATASAALNVIGMPINLALGRSIPGMPAWPSLASIGVGAVLLVYLRVFRASPSVQRASFAFLVNNSVISLALWVTSGHFAAAVDHWVPFQASKLAVLTVALLAPAELYVGVTTILIFTIPPLVKLWTFSPAVRSKLPVGEPFAMVAFGAFALFLLAYRLRRHALEVELLKSHAEAVALEASAGRFLAIRDMANTPLQTLEINAALLADVSEARPYADRIRRSVARLREWHGMLDAESARVRWSPEQEGFDPVEVMKATDVASSSTAPGSKRPLGKARA